VGRGGGTPSQAGREASGLDDPRRFWNPELARLYDLHPDDLARYRGTEIAQVLTHAQEQLKLERLRDQTILRLASWLEAQGG
jgi:hypothetical protein